MQATEIYSREFDAAFFKLSSDLQHRIESKISDLGALLGRYPHVQLKGREEFRLRVGDYRIIYDFNSDTAELYLIALGHRRAIYR